MLSNRCLLLVVVFIAENEQKCFPPVFGGKINRRERLLIYLGFSNCTLAVVDPSGMVKFTDTIQVDFEKFEAADDQPGVLLLRDTILSYRFVFFFFNLNEKLTFLKILYEIVQMQCDCCWQRSRLAKSYHFSEASR